MYYAVLAMTKQQLEPQYTGTRGGVPQFQQAPQALIWHVVGVFSADNAEAACRPPPKTAGLRQFLCGRGLPWGIDLMETEAQEFGVEDTTELSRLKQPEIRSREMAGIE